MRIAISGAHGTGKTTLAKKLAERLNLPRIDEVARSVALELNYKATKDVLEADRPKQAAYQWKVFDRQIEREKRSQFISDRSIFDVCAYTRLYELFHEYREQVNIATEHSANYDLIVFCPIVDHKQVHDDHFRLTDFKSQHDVELILRALLLHACKCKVLWLSNRRDEWLDEVLGAIQHDTTDN